MDERAARLRKITGAILLVTLGVWLVWDVFVASNGLEGDTISEITRDLSHYLYVIPYALCGIMGHFFWNKPTLEEGRPNRFKLWLVSCAVVFGIGFLIPPAHYMNTAFAIAGFCMGALLWPQGPRTK